MEILVKMKLQTTSFSATPLGKEGLSSHWEEKGRHEEMGLEKRFSYLA